MQEKQKYHLVKETGNKQTNKQTKNKQKNKTKKNKKTPKTIKTTKKDKISYRPHHAVMEDTIRYNTAQITSSYGLYPLPSCHHNYMMSNDHIRQATTPQWWLLRIIRKLMIIGLNWEETKQKHDYQKRLTNRSRKLGVEYAA